MKKFRKSPIAIVCYVFAAIFAAYFVATEVNTISTIYEYYAPYGVAPTVGEVVGYMIQQGIQPLAYAILVCMAGIILEAVRKLNPANWATDDEIAEAKEARKAAREAKKIAKGEAAKAAAEASVEFAEEPEAEQEHQEELSDEFSAVVIPEEADENPAAEPEEADENPAAEPEEADENPAAEPEEVDENLASELKKAVEAAESK